MSAQYSISELSSEFETTPRTLRFYEEKGLLNPARNGQQRIYSAADRTRLKLVLRGKRLGLTLEESAQIIKMYDPQSNNRKQLETLLQTIRDKKQQLLAQRKELELMIADLEQYESRTLAALEVGDMVSGSKREPA